MEHRSLTVGVLTPVTGGFFFGKILRGIARAVQRSGDRMLALQTLDASRYGRSEQSLRPLPYDLRVGWARIDGFISISTAVDRSYLEVVREAGKPVVLVSQYYDGFPCPSVVPDNHGGAFAAVTHLIEHGHRDIAFVGNLAQTDLKERFAGYRDALTAHGITVDPDLFFPASENLTPGGTAAAAALLASAKPVTAVMTGTDANAVGLLRELRKAGRTVPDDIAIIGFDGTEEAEQTDPPLSTVSANFDRLGELAVDLLLRLLHDDPVAPERHLGTSSLVTRRSCGCDLSGSRGRRSATPRDLPARDRLTVTLRALLVPETSSSPSVERTLAEGIDAGVALLSGQRTDPTGTDHLSLATRAFHTLASGHEQLSRVIDAFYDYLADREAVPSPSADDARPGTAPAIDTLLEFVHSLMGAESRTHAAFRIGMHQYLSVQYDVTGELVGNRNPSDLAWLAATGVPLACLGRWTGDSPQDAGRAMEAVLEVTGVHGAELAHLRGAHLPVAEFPPRALLDHVDGTDRIAFLLAVRTERGPWGVLALRGPIDVWSIDGREMFNHWTAQLGSALSQFDQRNELTTAYHRVQELVDELRVSEERYALAALSATDVLWDWDLGTGAVYYSERWLELLGEARALREVDPTPQEWLDRVHADDLDELTKTVDRCLQGLSSTLESEHRLRVANGSHRWVLCRGLAVPGIDGRVARLVGSFADVHERKQTEERLRRGAQHDQLTGLANRARFLERVQAEIDRCAVTPLRRFCVLFCDLDGFKPINDTYGHIVGDQLLAAVAKRLTGTVRGDDMVARLGGDEFGILLATAGQTEAAEVVDRVQASVGHPYHLDGRELRIGVSIGMATSDGGYTDAIDVLRAADGEMYQAKFAGRRAQQ
ncbi:MAG: diguanylate cyclase [Actinomycetales bacterium]|nr:diguanylate cyclase [Actinomycetales bacterium]